MAKERIFKIIKRVVMCTCGLTWNEYGEEEKLFCPNCWKATNDAQILEVVFKEVTQDEKKVR